MLMPSAPGPRPRLRRWLGGAAVLVALLATGAVAGARDAGYAAYIVHTGSMSPTMPPGDLVLTRARAPYAVGDVITFEHGLGPTDLVTHRIVAISASGIHTKGDANSTADAWTIPPSQVHGVEVAKLAHLGYAAFFLQQHTGVASLLTSALAVVLLWRGFFPPSPRRVWRASFVPTLRPVPRRRRFRRPSVRRRGACAAGGVPASWRAG